MKSTSYLSSFIDGITEALNDVRRLRISGEDKPGYNIGTVQQGFRGHSQIGNWPKVKLTRQISKLIIKHGIVFVSSAGNTGQEAGTVGFPASPVLTVANNCSGIH